MRFRRARSLIVTFAGGTPVLRNFMSAGAIPGDSFCVDLLSKAEHWCGIEQLCALYPGMHPAQLEPHVRGLTESGCLVVEHSEAATLDADYESDWQWEETAGLYHFGIQDPPWLNEAQSYQWLQQIYETQAPIPLMMSNEGLANVRGLGAPDLTQGVLSVMASRRSVRSYTAAPVSVEVLRDCLFAGLGITGWLNTQFAGDDPRLPLKMAPSGGGRNPYEGYVYARNVAGLQAGLYHYSAIDNTLGLMTDEPAVTPSQLFAGQNWTDGAAFGILLVANFERSMWKYRHPNAYRVVLMEAGHIAQNITLVAAEQGLSATPTGAANDSVARGLLGLNRIRQSLVYSVFVGYVDPQASECENFVPHG